MTINTTIYTAITGLIIGLVWSLALNLQIKSGLIYGGIIGIIVGLFISFIQKSVAARGNIQKGEAGYVTGSLLGLLILVGVGTGLIAWLIRFIFFR